MQLSTTPQSEAEIKFDFELNFCAEALLENLVVTVTADSMKINEDYFYREYVASLMQIAKENYIKLNRKEIKSMLNQRMMELRSSAEAIERYRQSQGVRKTRNVKPEIVKIEVPRIRKITFED